MKINGMNISDITDAGLTARLRAIRRTLIAAAAALVLLTLACAVHYIVAIIPVGIGRYVACFTDKQFITLFLQLLAVMLLASPLIPLLRERRAIRRELQNRYPGGIDE